MFFYIDTITMVRGYLKIPVVRALWDSRIAQWVEHYGIAG